MKEKPVIYEPHPVTPERKRELIQAGYRIIDAVFKPADYQNPSADDEQKEAKPRKRKGGADVSEQ